VNIVDAVLFQARHQPTALAVCAPGSRFNVVSYGRLTAFMKNIAARAAAAGLRRGDIVAVFAADPVFHLALVLALTKLGAVTLSIGTRVLPTDVPVDAVLSDSPGQFANTARVIVVDWTWMTEPVAAPAIVGDPDFDIGPATARIVLTSGTTGDPKAVALSHDMMIRRLQAYDAAFGNVTPASTRTFLDLGLAASFGFTWALHILARGGAIFYRGSDPAETMQAFDLYKVQCMIAAPAGVAEFLEYYERSPDFSCPFQVMLASGSLLSRVLSERVRARMCSNLLATYGSTEISPVAAAAAHRIANIKGAVGYLAPWVNAQSVDEADCPLPAGNEGRIRIRGHTCVDGYLGDAQESQKFFRNGWFYPGDIGTVTEDRLLVISGREKAVINLGGDKINPEAIEGVLASFPGVVHAAAFGRSDELGVERIWAFVTANADLDLDAIGRHCASILPQVFVPVKIFQIKNLPLNAMGRLDRASLNHVQPPELS
jgi:acyl-CoA synthetase (AMP-forming)/AMP-acid ligase II